MKRNFRIGKLGNGGLRYKLDILTIHPKVLTFQVDGSQLQLRIISLNSWNVPQATSGSINWDDSDDSIYLSQTSGESNETISISSDENSGHRRSKDIEFVGTDKSGNTQSKLLTVYQYGVYDGKNASTSESEYMKALDGGEAYSEYNKTN